MADFFDTVKNSVSQIFDAGANIPDAVSVFFGDNAAGISHNAWEKIRISKSIETMTSVFSLSMADKWRPENGGIGNIISGVSSSLKKTSWPFQVFTPIKIMIGSKPVVTGYIDKIDVSASNEDRILSISGRDKTGDLIDSSAFFGDERFTQQVEFKNITISELANRFTAQYQIKVKIDKGVDEGNPFQKFTIKPGESIFQMIERAAKLRGLLVLSDENGDVVLTNRAGGDIGEQPTASQASSDSLIAQLKKVPSISNPVSSFNYNANPFKKVADTQLIQGENILEARAQYDTTDRFHRYIVKGQQPGLSGIKGLNSVNPQGVAVDDFVPRRRTKFIVAHGAIDNAAAQRRANWEMIVRATKAVDVIVKVQGWLQQPKGRIWQVNELVTLKSGMIGIKNQKMLISEVEFMKSTEGTFTTLRLTRPDAYDVSKDKLEFDSDPSKELGHEEPSFSDLAKQVANSLIG